MKDRIVFSVKLRAYYYDAEDEPTYRVAVWEVDNWWEKMWYKQLGARGFASAFRTLKSGLKTLDEAKTFVDDFVTKVKETRSAIIDIELE
jgi:hypothetical protein